MSRVMVVFEDAFWRQLRPLTDLAPVPALAFGASSLAERLARLAGLPLAAVTGRPDAIAACRTMPRTTGLPEHGTAVCVNAAALPGPWLDALAADDTPVRLTRGDRLVGARLPVADVRAALEGGAPGEFDRRLAGAVERPVDAVLLERPWTLVACNPDSIVLDLLRTVTALDGDVHPSAVVLGAPVVVEAGARVDPMCVLDARSGPVVVRRGAVLAPHTVVVGPCVVGERTQLLGGVVGRSTFGPECRVAGEVEECVWQGYGNKRHQGFVGHSAIGEWVNLGALTTTSDLKNNYGVVRVVIDGREHDTGTRKLGALVGAHAKTGIGTLLPTGAVVGTGANLFGGGRFAPKAVPSFGWWDGERMVEHRVDAFTGTARVALSRRGETAGAADEAAWRRLFDATAAERTI